MPGGRGVGWAGRVGVCQSASRAAGRGGETAWGFPASGAVCRPTAGPTAPIRCSSVAPASERCHAVKSVDAAEVGHFGLAEDVVTLRHRRSAGCRGPGVRVRL